MATPPSKPIFKIADYPSSGLGSSDALDKFFSQMSNFTDNVVTCLNGGLTFGENSKCEIKVLNINTSTEVRTLLTLQGAWTSTTGLGYRRDSAGNVWVDGIVTGGVASSVIAPGLPAPAFDRSQVTTAASAYAALTYRTTGNIEHAAGSTTNFWCNFSYRPANPVPGVLSCFPLSVASNLASISSVRLAKLYATNSQTQVPCALGDIHWQAAKGGYSILNLPGLLLNTKYQATVVAFGS